MASRLTPAEQLDIISKAWGRQSGYAFFPWIDGLATCRSERIQSYHEGPAFLWPNDKDKILEHMAKRTNDDLYWCPSLFEKKKRQMEYAMDEHALWADLDEVDPNNIDDYPPTIAWESSPNRYQALWIISGGDVQGASWHGGENHRLTQYLGADPSGWDTTQLLRIPGWKNHKPEHRGGTKEGPNEKLGPAVQGKLLWKGGRRYLPDEFDDLPETGPGVQVQEVLEDEISRVDRRQVWDRIRLKLAPAVRELFSARESMGDRSEKLWYMMRCLADVGCTVTEIVAVVRPTVWNKFEGRADELKRLVTEASKAIEQRSEEITEGLEKEREAKPKPTRLFTLIKDIQIPEWLVKNVWAVGSCGFIAGQPKSFKSWLGLDLAMSVASGIPFLDHFEVVNPGPVLYIQEEDPLPTVKMRSDKVWPSKLSDKIVIDDGQLVWVPPSEGQFDGPDVAAYIGEGFTISDGGWQVWLDEVLEEGFEGKPYAMVVIDPLMMVAGDVEENRAQEMTEKVFKPLKQLSRKHKVAEAIVHHMRKGDPTRPTRGGQLMLGSVANHAWSEDSLYLRPGRGGEIIVEKESKHTTSGSFRVARLRNKGWTPAVIDDRSGEEGDEQDMSIAQGAAQEGKKRTNGQSKGRGPSKISQALEELGPGIHLTGKIADAMGVSRNGAYRQLTRLAESGKLVTKVGPGKWEVKS